MRDPDIALADMTPSRVARGLSVLLRVGLVLLALAVALGVLMCVVMLVPNGFRTEILNDLGGAASSGTLAVAGLSAAVIAGCWFIVLRMLRYVVGTVIEGDPFVPENINRLRWIWVVIAGSEIFRMVIVLFSGIAVNSASVTSAENGLDIRIGTWFFIFVIAALSEAFRVGAEMRRDQELTI